MARLATLSRAHLIHSLGAANVLIVMACGGSNPSGSASSGGPGLGDGPDASENLGGSAPTRTSTVPPAGGTAAVPSSTRTAGSSAYVSGGHSTTGGADGSGTGGAGLFATGGAPNRAGSGALSGGVSSVDAAGGTLSATGGVHVTGGSSGVGGSRTSGGHSSASGGQQSSTGGSGSATAGSNGKSAPSEGCAAMTTPTSGRFSIEVADTAREYIIKLPDDYDPKHPYPLVFAFHGRQYSAESVASGGPPGNGPYYGLESEANGDAIFVAPQALQSSWTNEGGRDLAFVSAMVSRFEAELCVDQNRIFSTGFSMGAIMTIAIGCAQAGVFRAIAPMSGAIQGGCTGSQPIAYWASHGTRDTTITPASGESARNAFIARNGCDENSTIAGTPAGCVNYSGCTDGYPTTWCTFDGAHEPPPFAGQAIWAFFSQF